MVRGKEAKRKLFAPPKPVPRKRTSAHGTGKISTAAAKVAAGAKQQRVPTRAPNASSTHYTKTPKNKNSPSDKPMRVSVKNLRKTQRGRLELKCRGYTKMQGILVNPSVIKKCAPKPRVVGKTSNAKIVHKPKHVKGTVQQREAKQKLFARMGINAKNHNRYLNSVSV